MTKADIINEIAEQTGLQRKEVSVVVEAFMETVKSTMLLKDSSRHWQRHDHNHRGSRYSGFQACESLRRRDERRVNNKNIFYITTF